GRLPRSGGQEFGLRRTLFLHRARPTGRARWQWPVYWLWPPLRKKREGCKGGTNASRCVRARGIQRRMGRDNQLAAIRQGLPLAASQPAIGELTFRVRKRGEWSGVAHLACWSLCSARIRRRLRIANWRRLGGLSLDVRICAGCGEIGF